MRAHRLLVWVVAILVGFAALCASIFFLAQAISEPWKGGDEERPVREEGGVRQVSTVEGDHLAVYDGQHFEPRFWNGTNLGATLPGHAPGELVPTEDNYLAWFEQMKDANVDVVRVYTILNPDFYEALARFNYGRDDPLWLMQGIWSPEEELIGEDEEGNDAYADEITRKFEDEIKDSVRVVHGDADLPEKPGHASGSFRNDVSPYLLGWMVGTEWDPNAVKKTNDAHSGVEPFSGRYFQATEDANPFESWLAAKLDMLAEEEMRYGWQHPVSLTNWLTTDPLSHPDEANRKEDLASVDAMHLKPTDAWSAGYFASFHIYPYYPDFLNFEEKYQDYQAEDGKVDPYAGYLNELRAHHKNIPLIVAEFGLPTSRGMAHEGPLGRNQGHHTEKEQGDMEAQMLRRMHEEGYDGGFHFAWQDEWFKFTWNTKDLNIPDERRPMWPNKLTNEQNFGLIANEPGPESDAIYLDGKTDDWDRRSSLKNTVSGFFSGKDTGVTEKSYTGFDLSIAHDEGYLYLLAEKKDGNWDLEKEGLTVGFGTLPSGSEKANEAPGISFPDGGIQALMRIGGERYSQMYINSAYDYHTWLYGSEYKVLPVPDDAADVQAGNFLPWKLMLNRPLYLPETERTIPYQEFDVGVLNPGVSDPESPEFDNLADWYAEGNVLEVRIPWMMLGFTDPSTHHVWDNFYSAGGISTAETEELRVYPALRTTSDSSEAQEKDVSVEPIHYEWDGWDAPKFYERQKKSYPIMREAFADKSLTHAGDTDAR